MKVVILDLDGTVIDTIGGIGNAANLSLVKFGFKPQDRQFYTKAVGNGAKALIEKAMGPASSDAELSATILSDFLKEYGIHWEIDLRMYDGVKELITTLNKKGYKVAVNTNKPDVIAQKIVRSFFDEKQVVEIIGSQKAFPNKPNPEGTFQILKHLNALASECVYIGDSSVDILTAKNAGVKSIAVTWGYGELSELGGADYIVNDTKAILDLLV